MKIGLRITSQRKILMGFSVGVVLVILVTLGTYQNVVAYESAASSLSQDNLIKSDLSLLLTDIYNVQEGERQFIATGNDTNIELYLAAASSVSGQMKFNLIPDSNLTDEYRTLQNAVSEETTLMQMTLTIEQTQGLVAAQQHLVQSASQDEGYAYAISGAIGRMDARMDILEAQEVTFAAQRGARETELIFLYSVFALGLITFAAYVIDRRIKREAQEMQVANLLQDVLTHDLRNYNQSLLLSAGILKERVGGDEDSIALIEGVIQRVEHSTDMIARGQRLARVIAEGATTLHPVDLVGSMEGALAEVRKMFPEKEVHEQLEIRRINPSDPPADPGSSRVLVLADERLDEVFVNLFSNAVKFTDGNVVPLEITVLPSAPGAWLGSRMVIGRPYWWISIRDHGSGVPLGQRGSLFERVPESPHSAGLGMIIVKSLVVGRYGGTVTVDHSDPRPSRHAGDETAGPTGTTVLLSLVRA